MIHIQNNGGYNMQISSRFTIAVHILICVELYGDEAPATSETLAGSIGAHPVVIRRILGHGCAARPQLPQFAILHRLAQARFVLQRKRF